MQEALDYIANGISLFSIAVIIYGAILALVSFVRSQMSKDKYDGIRQVRMQFGGYLLLGLELLIGADVIKTIVEPSYEELIILAGTVVIRTVMSVFLNREIKELEKEKEEKEA